MKLRDLVVEKAILTDLAATDRDGAVGELVDALISARAAKKTDRDELVKSIIKREKKGSTGFGHGVAVPHVKQTDVKKLAVAVGISQEGIDFNALDRQPVHIIFLLLSPEERQEEHLDAMKAIFDFLSKETYRRFLRQMNSADEVLQLLEEADESAAVP